MHSILPTSGPHLAAYIEFYSKFLLFNNLKNDTLVAHYTKIDTI
jgi:hypothetical protein